MRIFDRLSRLAARDPAFANTDARRASIGILAAFLAPALLVYALLRYRVIATGQSNQCTLSPHTINP